ncbi:MAG: N-acetylmuramoyl-L-alanine amidase [Candidatus Eremiobacteraeota bacterium]|nr:N-acetylmuramoyl-L-alanine amidase [Candidatus Eremiobacteraeota bacterium]MCW5870080.1 N-acetylmuramoyl-L-alanine amidase [Candidatus Eremiobacteraeota bacterium]
MKKTLLFILLGVPVWAEPIWTVVSPQFPLDTPEGQWVELEVSGPAGRHPSLQTARTTTSLAEARAGVYRTRFQPAVGDVTLDGQMLGSCRTHSGSLGVFEVTKENAVLRTGPTSDYDRLTPVTRGVRLEAVERQGDYYRFHTPSGWLRLSEGMLLGPEASLGNGLLTVIRVSEPDNIVRLTMGSPCAWQVRQDVENRKFWLDLPGVPSATFHTAYAQNSQAIPAIRLHPLGENGTTVEIPLRQRLWGYRLAWKGDTLEFAPTPAPRIDPKYPLRGVRITVDAGHGGEDSGTVGLDLHVKEKDLNLSVARALRDQLKKAGAIVTMTRDGDHQVAPESAPAEAELQSRVDVALRSRAQLFVSVHHNARPDVQDGRVSHGAHIYYYQPASRGLAQAIAAPLARAIGEPSYQHFWRSFAVIRQPEMPAVLVECNFLSNPGLEKGMLHDRAYPQKAARGIFEGVTRFLVRDM